MEQHPLYRSLTLGIPLLEQLKILVRHRADEPIARRQYRPEAFTVDPRVDGERIVLIEDLWVTGATSVSAAGRLSIAGASVVVVPIAREVNADFTDKDHPYRAQMNMRHDISEWPRG